MDAIKGFLYVYEVDSEWLLIFQALFNDVPQWDDLSALCTISYFENQTVLHEGFPPHLPLSGKVFCTVLLKTRERSVIVAITKVSFFWYPNDYPLPLLSCNNFCFPDVIELDIALLKALNIT